MAKKEEKFRVLITPLDPDAQNDIIYGACNEDQIRVKPRTWVELTKGQIEVLQNAVIVTTRIVDTGKMRSLGEEPILEDIKTPLYSIEYEDKADKRLIQENERLRYKIEQLGKANNDRVHESVDTVAGAV